MPARITIIDYDPRWPDLYLRQAERIRSALGEQVLLLEHTGSTSVPGLAAKPIIDMLLVVEDSSDEAAYVEKLEGVDYCLHVREPAWYEHRLFKGPDTSMNLHVFSAGCPEIDRILSFRDWLRQNEPDRELYAQTKRELARKDWKDIDEYAAAKTAIIEIIIARALNRSTR